MLLIPVENRKNAGTQFTSGVQAAAKKSLKSEKSKKIHLRQYEIIARQMRYSDKATQQGEMEQNKSFFMQRAIEEALDGIEHGHGGPFGSVVVKDGIVIGRGHNRVLGNHDATAHGEVEAIRDAGRRLGTHDLSSCDIYTTGEPCHMCLCACLWANIKHIYYGCTINDNAIVGFRDEHFNQIFAGRDLLEGYMTELDRDSCLKLFDKYLHIPHGEY